ncbi:pilus assembly protein CpaE [Alkalibacillus filiformis]|uniref:Pilus assembly protein CpaE n=1 Tax=Alkalibacillus filiformis TaxID=200990 RepID=A0ABU0DQQ4_9BACI|nr:AAA family ATPase [Alkalibacillus filiformis]MDQ0350779.1 pilus assembly protein CpaE [Alkalibacillus filiformis]
MKILGITNQLNQTLSVQRAAQELGHSLQWFESVQELKSSIEPDEEMIILIYENDERDLYELCEEISFQFENVSTVLCMPEHQVDVKKVIRSGAIDVIDKPYSYVDVLKGLSELPTVKRNQSSSWQNQEEKLGKVLTVCSTKGGVGKTTVSTNLAVSLAKQSNSVAIVDLDLQFGDVDLFLDLKPKKTVYEWVKEASSHSDIKNYMTSHESGVDLLASPIRPEFAEAVTGDDIERAIEALKSVYDWVIIDTPPTLIETDIVALEQSDEVILVTSMDLPTLKNCKLYLETMESIHIKKPLKLVVNRKSKKIKGMKVETVTSVLGQSTFAEIPNDEKNVVTSVNEGIPLVISTPRAPAAKAILKLAGKLDENKPEKKKGVLFKKAVNA